MVQRDPPGRFITRDHYRDNSVPGALSSGFMVTPLGYLFMNSEDCPVLFLNNLRAKHVSHDVTMNWRTLITKTDNLNATPAENNLHHTYAYCYDVSLYFLWSLSN